MAPKPLALTAVALSLGFAAAASADVLVLRATGGATASYRPGQSLRDNHLIRLRTGESVTILGKGQTRVFRGPVQYRPSDPVRAAPRTTSPTTNNRIAGMSLSAIERGRISGPSVLIARAAGPSAQQFRPGRALPANAQVTCEPAIHWS
jgi:hypothetical protein